MVPHRLSNEQMLLVEESFRRLAPKGAALAATFYLRLAYDAAAVPLASNDCEQHHRQKSWLSLLAQFVASLRTYLGTPSEVSCDQARQNCQSVLGRVLNPSPTFKRVVEQNITGADLGYDPEQHDIWRTTFLKTLSRFLPNVWDRTLETAWAEAFETMMASIVAQEALSV